MDVLRKMFKSNDSNKDTDSAAGKDEFRKPQWFEETETDDELFDDDRKFAFQIFTNPIEVQKHFERQLQQILEAVSEFDENEVKVDKNFKEEFLKPGFEDGIFKEFQEENQKQYFDTDLDGEIYADQLHSLMQRIGTEDAKQQSIIPRNDLKGFRKPSITKKKLTDEETILGRIHGTLIDEDNRPRMPRLRPDIMTPMTPMLPRNGAPFGGVFEGTYQGPKMFSQSIMTKTVRKPDGSYETTKTTQDSQGNKSTTITRTIDGKTETITTYNGIGGSGSIKQDSQKKAEMQVYSDRNIYVTQQGYAMPRNLW